MSVTINKQKSKGAAKSKSATHSKISHCIDEMGELDVRISELQCSIEPLSKKYGVLQSELCELVDEQLKPEQKKTFEGEVYEADVSAKGNSTTITNMKKVFNLFKDAGDDLHFELMKFNIGDLRKYLSPKQIEKVTETERTGKRSVKISKSA